MSRWGYIFLYRFIPTTYFVGYSNTRIYLYKILCKRDIENNLKNDHYSSLFNIGYIYYLPSFVLITNAYNNNKTLRLKMGDNLILFCIVIHRIAVTRSYFLNSKYLFVYFFIWRLHPTLLTNHLFDRLIYYDHWCSYAIIGLDKT